MAAIIEDFEIILAITVVLSKVDDLLCNLEMTAVLGNIKDPDVEVVDIFKYPT